LFNFVPCGRVAEARHGWLLKAELPQ
jgi:hypothetical protein